MNFTEILDEHVVSPGEYILHTPSNQVVLCGAFNKKLNEIRVLANGKMFTDKITNFKKISMSNKERKRLASQDVRVVVENSNDQKVVSFCLVQLQILKQRERRLREELLDCKIQTEFLLETVKDLNKNNDR